MSLTPFTLNYLSPQQQTVSRFRRLAQAKLQLTNHSDQATAFRLMATDMAQQCHIEFALPRQGYFVGPVEFALLPQQTATIPLQITLPRPPWLGLSDQSHYFTLTVTHLESNQTRMVLGQIAHRPLIGAGLMTFMAMFGFMVCGVFIGQSDWFTAPPEPIVKAASVKPTATFVRPYWVDHPYPTVTPTVDRNKLGYEAIFQEVASMYNLDWRILAATAQVESHLNPYALGHDGDMGLMQIIPKTWNEWAPKAKADITKPYDPYNNVQVGAAYLAYLKGYCQQRGYTDIRWALVAYNWGPQNISRLAERQGTWEDVPPKQQLYAMRVIQLASTVASFLPTPTPAPPIGH